MPRILLLALLLFAATAMHAQTRSGGLKGLSGHDATGTASIAKAGNGYQVVLSADFAVDRGPDLRIYLANSLNGKAISKDGLELPLLTSQSGSQTYALPAGVNPADYRYVIIHCKRYSIPFGYAELK